MNNDTFIFHNATNTEEPQVPFSGKKLKWANDNQMGISSQFTFDSKDISTNGDISALSEAFIAIPYLISIVGDGTSVFYASTTEYINHAFCQLKNGIHLIDSVSLQWGQETINSTQQNVNQLLNYKILSNYTREEYDKWSDPMMFAVNETSGITFSGSSATAAGDGVTNNAFAPATTYASGCFTSQNSGLLKRARNVYPQTTLTKGYNSIATTSLSTDLFNCGVNYLGDNGGTTTARKYFVNCLVTIRLQDIFDIFKQVDLCVNPNFRMVITLNTCKATMTIGTNTLIHTSYQQLSGNTNPILVASSAVNNPNNTLVATAGARGVITIEGNLPKANGTYSTNGIIEAVRLYVPTYTLTAPAASQLMSGTEKGWKKIYFEDYVYYPLSAVVAGTSFSQQISGGESDMLGLVIIPQLVAGTSGCNCALTSLNPEQSLFDTSPSTTAPLVTFQELNILVGGEQLWTQDAKYTFQEYQLEVSKIWSINNGNSELTSGLLTAQSWLQGHRTIIADISRMGLGYNKNLVVKGRINGTGNMNLRCFIIKLKCMMLNLVTGESKMIPIERDEVLKMRS